MPAHWDIHRGPFQLEITRVREDHYLTLLLFFLSILLVLRKHLWTFSQVLGAWPSSRSGVSKRRRRRHSLFQYWTQKSQRQSARRCQFCWMEEKLCVRYVSNARTRSAPVSISLYFFVLVKLLGLLEQEGVSRTVYLISTFSIVVRQNVLHVQYHAASRSVFRGYHAMGYCTRFGREWRYQKVRTRLRNRRLHQKASTIVDKSVFFSNVGSTWDQSSAPTRMFKV